MRKWEYTCKSAPALRALLNNETPHPTILTQLVGCYEEIKGETANTFLLHECAGQIDDINDLLEALKEGDLNHQESEDAVNYLLGQFWDVCDGYRIWCDV